MWGIKQGLPYSYNSDEASHFVPPAIAFFSHDLNPHYFLNPPAYSYLLHIVFELWFGSADAVARTYSTDPTAVFVVARLVAAALGTVAVGLHLPGRSPPVSRAIGLIAAAIMAVAFLPVFYSHLALNDVPTLAPVSLALYAAAGVVRFGRRRDYVLCGVAIGLAAATKYTGAFVLACLLVAAVQDGAGGSMAQSARRFALAVGVALAAFVVANPYALLSFIGVSLRGLPASLAGRRGGPGQARLARQWRRLLPVDADLGLWLGPRAGRGGWSGAARGAPAHRHGADADPGTDRLRHLHGQPAAVLRALADADLPDPGPPGRLRHL